MVERTRLRERTAQHPAHDAGDECTRYDGRTKIDARTQCAPSWIREPVIHAAGHAGQRSGQHRAHQVPSLVCEEREAEFRTQSLHDADDERSTGTPLVAEKELKHRRDGLRVQRGAGFADDDRRKWPREEPERVEQTFESWGDGFEQRQRRRAEEIPHPEDDAGCGGDGRRGHHVDDAPSAGHMDGR